MFSVKTFNRSSTNCFTFCDKHEQFKSEQSAYITYFLSTVSFNQNIECLKIFSTYKLIFAISMTLPTKMNLPEIQRYLIYIYHRFYSFFISHMLFLYIIFSSIITTICNILLIFY